MHSFQLMFPVGLVQQTPATLLWSTDHRPGNQLDFCIWPRESSDHEV